ncbi:MAG: zinc ribbon domain-containing protein [Bacillota bacterium]
MTLIIFLLISIAIYYLLIYRYDYFNSNKNGKLVCKSCGSHVEKDYNVCPICKESLKRPCPKCSSMLDVKWNFCPFCEYDLKKGESF